MSLPRFWKTQARAPSLTAGRLWVQYCVSVRECMETTCHIGQVGGQ